MYRKGLLIFASMVMAFLVVPSSFALAAGGPTISIRLVNYVGNQPSVTVQTTGTYSKDVNNMRLGGSDRFAVAANVADQGWSHAGTVFLANYLAYADALSATPLAYKMNAPILLTEKDDLTQTTKDEINKLHPTTIYIIGGPVSVTQNVVNELVGMGINSNNIHRIGGQDRFEVAQNVASHLGNYSKAVVADGLVFADSLSIAPYAARHGYPILLTMPKKVPSSTLKALGNHTSIVVGGPNSVDSDVYSKVNATMRIGGADRYEVASNVIRKLGLDPDHAFVATGLKFADALTGSVLAAKEDVPVLLTGPNSLPTYTSQVIQDKNINVFTVLGGTASVSDNVKDSKLPSRISLNSNTNYEVKNENGGLTIYKGPQLVYHFDGDFTLDTSYRTSNVMTIAGQMYMGNMEFTQEGSDVRPINLNIPLKDYLKGVVPNESIPSWDLAALEAQAVAARTLAYRNAGKIEPDSQAFQVYGGVNWDFGDKEYATSNQAVEDTIGEVLEYNGNLIDAAYSSSNGGWTEASANVWNPTPYLIAKQDTFDAQHDSSWHVEVNKTQINLTGLDMHRPGYWWWSVSEADPKFDNVLIDWLHSNGYKGRDIKITSIKSIDNLKKFPTGQRIDTADFTFNFAVYSSDYSDPVSYDSKHNLIIHNIKATISINDFRPLFDSTLLDLNNPIVDEGSKLKIQGTGWGHGIGMSQWGAEKRAEAGQSYQDILKFYYPGTTLTKVY